MAKYGLKALLTLLKSDQAADIDKDADDKRHAELLEPLWAVAWSRVVDGIDTFGPKQATVKLFALQVSILRIVSFVFAVLECLEIYRSQAHPWCSDDI